VNEKIDPDKFKNIKCDTQAKWHLDFERDSFYILKVVNRIARPDFCIFVK